MNEDTITNWGVTMDHDPYMAPELRRQYLCGINGAGMNIVTSNIRGQRDGKIVTNNTIYTLLDVAPDYEKMFPGAKDRLMNSATPV